MIGDRLRTWRRGRALAKRWPRPKRFDYNLIVIGAGSAGLVAAYVGAAAKAKVALIERDRMGGDCLNTGCVPSKALIRVAKLMQQIRQADRFGLTEARAAVDFPAVMARVRTAIGAVAPHDSVERYAGLGVDVIAGAARIASPWTVAVETAAGARLLSARTIVIASGGRPILPDLPGLADAEPLTSDTLWGLAVLPKRLVVLGGGSIGCELAQAFARLGSTVTIVEAAARVLGREEPQAAELIAATFAAEGITVLTGHQAIAVEQRDGERRLHCRRGADGAAIAVPFDRILVAVGRRAVTEGLGLEELGIETTAAGTIAVDAYLATTVPSIYAAGDVAGPIQLTHFAGHMAWHAAVNGLFGWIKRFRVDASVVPRVTFTDPEVASVGLTEAEALRRGVRFERTRFSLDDLDRALVDGAPAGFVSVLTVPGRDRILGATVVGAHAGDMLGEFTLAMKRGFGLKAILSTIHPYPTWSEANRQAAGRWRQAHAPRWALAWLARLNAFRR